MLPFIILTRRSYRRKALRSDLTLLSAGLIGFVIAWFFTPRTGQENRKMAIKATTNTFRTTSHLVNQVIQSAHQRIASIVDAIDRAAETTKYPAENSLHHAEK